MNGRHPTMNSRPPRVTTVLLQRLSRALKRHIAAALKGDDAGVHQARVTSRRLREAVPVLATGLTGSKAGKARKKIRRVTRALGTVRELDVTVQLLDELARSPNVSRDAVEDVRTRVMKERDGRRKLMIERLERVKTDKLDRRLASVGEALDQAINEPWRKALAARLLTRSRRLLDVMTDAGHMYAPERLHAVRIAAKKLRYGLELASDSGLKQAAPHVRTICRCSKRTSPPCRPSRALGAHERPSRIWIDTSRGSAATCTDATWRHRPRCARPQRPCARSLFRSWRRRQAAHGRSR